MKCVKMDINKIINFHWLVVVITGLYTHLRQICIIGFCLDDENNQNTMSFEHSYASIIFVFSVLCLLAEYKLWPRSLKEPPLQLMFVYEILVAALVTNLAMILIWMPLMQGISCLTSEATKWMRWLNELPFLDKVTFLQNIASYLDTEAAASHSAMCLAILSLVWMLDATESLDGIFDIITKGNTKSIYEQQNKIKKKITFSNPEVSDYFWYTSCKQWYRELCNKID